METDDCFLQYDYHYEPFELNDVGNFLWSEFSIIAGAHFNWTKTGWSFNEPNQLNPIISGIVAKTFTAMRKEKSPKKDPLEHKIQRNFNEPACGAADPYPYVDSDPPSISDLKNKYM